ncbi:MAG: M23 family metallopeptidase [Alphaproteobacteria bacterium]
MFRSDGQVRYVNLTTRMQIAGIGALCFILLALIMWAGSQTIINKIQAGELAQREAMIIEGKLAYQDLMLDMKQHRQNLNQTLSKELSENSPDELETMEGLTRTLDAFVGRLSMDLEGDNVLANQIIKTRNTLYAEVNALNTKLEQEQAARQDLIASLSILNELSQAQYSDQYFTNPSTDAEVNATEMVKISQEAEAGAPSTSLPASNDPAIMAKSISQQVTNLKQLFHLQSSVSDQFNHFVDQNIYMQERILEKTTVPLPKLLALVGVNPAAGGESPLMGDSLDHQLAGPALMLAESQQGLELKLAKLSAMERLLGCLPIYSPVDYYHVTSRFGKRKDPITGRAARHAGLDLAGWPGIDIYASASGKVVKALRHSAYGNMVEINHGCKIATRYGHLKSINVKKGQIVEYRDVIGALGSTGRSTGPHLHFEIIMNGHHIDPEPFIEAGRYVYKISTKNAEQSASN